MKRTPKSRAGDERQSASESTGRSSDTARPAAALHGQYGNQEVRRLFEAGAMDGVTDRRSRSGDSGNGDVGAEARRPLDVSHPDDASEREAERVADEVMRRPDAETADGVDGIRVRTSGRGRSGDQVQRAAIGETSVETLHLTPSNFLVVPDDEKDRVEGAMRILDGIVGDRERYAECHDFFATHTNDDRPLERVHDRARIWKSPSAEPGHYGESPGGSDEHVAYTELAWRWGRWTLAATFMHEYAHLCDIDHPYSELAVEAAGLPTLSDVPD